MVKFKYETNILEQVLKQIKNCEQFFKELNDCTLLKVSLEIFVIDTSSLPINGRIVKVLKWCLWHIQQVGISPLSDML